MKNENYIRFAKEIREKVLEMIHRAKASHIGGAFSMADILSVLYEGVLNIKPDEPQWENRDRFILSKGHACTALYAALALKGFFAKEELATYGQDDVRLMSHTNHKVPGVELSTGSLGHGLSVACGVAVAAKVKKKNWKTYCLLSDGELDEGSNWESLLFIAHHKLTNLITIIDYNKIQALGNTNEVMNLEPLTTKFLAFNLTPIEIDGHNHEEIEKAFLTKTDNPKVIIAHTIKGKGVDFMENSLLWHYRNPDDNQFVESMKQLSK